nr:hypothetical protein [Planococcus ruber]
MINELRANLEANADVSIVKQQTWKLPIVFYDVGFSRVKRLKMDVLMKMLLFAFQETEIHRAANLAEFLLVEELFIRDLMEKMQRTGLIQLEKRGYRLTAKGFDYLEKGIFDEEMEGDDTVMSFSSVHDKYALASQNGHPEASEAMPLYRYFKKATLNKERVQQLLLAEMIFPEEEGFQIIATDVTSCIEQETDFVPCIEFQLHDAKQDLFYARIWNTWSGSWDETLAKQIEEREVVSWRKAMGELKK